MHSRLQVEKLKFLKYLAISYLEFGYIAICQFFAYTYVTLVTGKLLDMKNNVQHLFENLHTVQ